MTSFFEHQRTSYKRNYLRNLIALASSDGMLDGDERGLIARIGLKRGLKAWQIQELLDDNNKNEVFLPESMSNRMNMLYDLMQIIYADSMVDAKEVEFMVSLVEAFQLRPEIIGQLTVLFENSAPTPDEWKEFVEFVSVNLVIDRAA